MVALLSKTNPASSPIPSNGSVQLELSVMPEDLFPHNNNRYMEVASTNSYVLAQCEGSAGPQFLLFNEANRPIEIPKDLLPSAAISAADVSRALTSATGDLSTTSMAFGTSFSELAGQMGLVEEEASELYNNIRSYADESGNITTPTVAALGEKSLAARRFQLFSDSKERYICLARGNSLTLYRTVDDDLRPLPPEKWKRTEIKDRNAISAAQIEEMPVLEEFCSSDKGRPISGLQCAISFNNGVLTVVDTKRGIRVFNEAASCYALDPCHDGHLYFAGENGTLKTIDLMQMHEKALSVETPPFRSEGKIESMRFDPHGNFLLALIEVEDSHSLLIVEKDSCKIAGRIDNVGSDFDMNRSGEIYYIDSDNRLRAATTNLNQFSPDGLQEAREADKKRLLHLLTSAQTATLPELPPRDVQSTEAQGAVIQDKDSAARNDVLVQATQSINERLMPDVDSATTVPALEELLGRIEILKQGNGFRTYPQVFAEVEERIAEKMDTLETERLVEKLRDFRSTLEQSLDASHLRMLHESWSSIESLRRNLVISSPTVRNAVDTEFREVKTTAQELIERLEQEVKGQLEQRFTAVEKAVKETENMRELNMLLAASEVVEFETLVSSISDAAARKAWRAKYRELLRVQEESIRGRQGADQQQQMTRVAETIEDAREVLDSIKEELQQIYVPSEMARWRHRNPLVLRYRSLVMGLPEDMRDASMKELDSLLDQRHKELVQAEGASIVRTSEKVAFKQEEFPIFPEMRLMWRPCVKTIKGREDLGQLVFRDTAGREYEPDCQPVPFDIENPDTKTAIEFHRSDAEAYFESLKAPIPEWNQMWVLNDWVLGYLDQIAEACREQLTLGSGIVILEGEGGCGKDVLWKMFAHLTHRGLCEIPFNIQTEKEDITYDFIFDPQQGTIRVPSKLVQNSQVPGSILSLGEVNTAAPGVLKILNPAMDDSRRIGDRQMDRTVLLVGTMNPQYYLGTQKISQEILSRATIIRIDYPPFRDSNGRYLPYEAEIASKHIPALADIPQKEFYAMWDYLVNSDPTSGGDSYLTDERKALINHLFRVVATADQIRQAYGAYHRAEAEAKRASFTFSLRETRNIAARLRPESKVGDVIKRIVLPKIAEPEECLRVQGMIEDPPIS